MYFVILELLYLIAPVSYAEAIKQLSIRYSFTETS